MTTLLHSNGSKCAGEDPDTIEKLLTVLENYTIDQRFFKKYNPRKYNKKAPEVAYLTPIDIIKEDKHKSKIFKGSKNVFMFFGNFEEISHVFRIETTNKTDILKLYKAIIKNKGFKKYHKNPEFNKVEDTIKTL